MDRSGGPGGSPRAWEGGSPLPPCHGRADPGSPRSLLTAALACAGRRAPQPRPLLFSRAGVSASEHVLLVVPLLDLSPAAQLPLPPVLPVLSPTAKAAPGAAAIAEGAAADSTSRSPFFSAPVASMSSCLASWASCRCMAHIPGCACIFGSFADNIYTSCSQPRAPCCGSPLPGRGRQMSSAARVAPGNPGVDLRLFKRRKRSGGAELAPALPLVALAVPADAQAGPALVPPVPGRLLAVRGSVFAAPAEPVLPADLAAVPAAPAEAALPRAGPPRSRPTVPDRGVHRHLFQAASIRPSGRSHVQVSMRVWGRVGLSHLVPMSTLSSRLACWCFTGHLLLLE